MEFYTMAEVAQMMKVKQTTVNEWIRGGRLSASRFAGTKMIRVSREDIDAFYKSNRVEVSGGEKS